MIILIIVITIKYCFALFSPTTVFVPGMFGSGFVYLAATGGFIRCGSVNDVR